MAGEIQLEIVTPRGRALGATVDEVTAPGAAGEFGVLPGHLPLLAALRTGIVTYRQGAETKRCAVGAGFAEAGPDRLILLTDQYAERQGIDPVLIRKELAEVQAHLQRLESVAIAFADTKDPEAGLAEARAERERFVGRENWLAVQLELYGDPPPATMRPYEEFGPPPPPPEDEVPQPESEAAGSPGSVAKPVDGTPERSERSVAKPDEKK